MSEQMLHPSQMHRKFERVAMRKAPQKYLETLRFI